MDHVGAVTDVDYSPTGKEFVTGGYDKSIRIYQVNKGHSREIYHTKRMQRLSAVAWSLDDKYILSGSDEMNIRVWKARASEKLGVVRHFHYQFYLRLRSKVIVTFFSSRPFVFYSWGLANVRLCITATRSKKNSPGIPKSSELRVTDKCPNTFTRPKRSYEQFAKSPSASTLLLFSIIVKIGTFVSSP